jgi:hypothetical protein
MNIKISPKRNPLQSARNALSNVQKTVTAKAEQAKTAVATQVQQAKTAATEKINEVKPQVEKIQAEVTKTVTAGWNAQQGASNLGEVRKAYIDAAKHTSTEVRNGYKTAVFRQPMKQGGIFKAAPGAFNEAVKEASNTATAAKVSGTIKKVPEWLGGGDKLNKLGNALDRKIAKGSGVWEQVASPLTTAYDATQIPKSVGETVSKLKQAAKSGKASEWSDARQSAIDNAKSSVETTQTATQLGLQYAKKKVIDRAIRTDLKKLATNPSIAKKVANSKVAAKVAERAAAGQLTKGIYETTVRAAERFGTKGLAKTASRFVVGANVALAGLDVATAVNTQRDSRKTHLQKAAAWITAGGSVASATNVPVVSQVGAGASLISDAVGSFLPDKS